MVANQRTASKLKGITFRGEHMRAYLQGILWILFSIAIRVGAAPSGGSEQVTPLLDQLPQGSVLILGEFHNLPSQTEHARWIVEQLQKRGHRVQVGMEFVEFPLQNSADTWKSGWMTDDEFSKVARWPLQSFQIYKPIYIQADAIIALNSPRKLTGKIAKEGLESLTPDDQLLLPPQFTLGRDVYRERFKESMPHLPSPQDLDRYFAAQSLWDDTMAWKTVETMMSHKRDTIVIVVGDFHTAYGGGLPSRLRARLGAAGEALAGRQVVTISQINTKGMSQNEIQELVAPDRGEERADFVWLEDDLHLLNLPDVLELRHIVQQYYPQE